MTIGEGGHPASAARSAASRRWPRARRSAGARATRRPVPTGRPCARWRRPTPSRPITSWRRRAGATSWRCGFSTTRPAGSASASPISCISIRRGHRHRRWALRRAGPPASRHRAHRPRPRDARLSRRAAGCSPPRRGRGAGRRGEPRVRELKPARTSLDEPSGRPCPVHETSEHPATPLRARTGRRDLAPRARDMARRACARPAASRLRSSARSRACSAIAVIQSARSALPFPTIEGELGVQLRVQGGQRLVARGGDDRRWMSWLMRKYSARSSRSKAAVSASCRCAIAAISASVAERAAHPRQNLPAPPGPTASPRSGRRGMAHHRSALRLDPHQPLGRQHLQRVAQRRARDAEPVGQLPLTAAAFRTPAPRSR